ncbi:hypothetical protein [Paenibacillus taichungensis]
MDKVAPTGSITINEGAAYTASLQVTLGFTLGAGVDDVKLIQLSNDNVTWSAEETYNASMSYTLTAGDGSKSVYVRLIDRAGNVGSAQDSITGGQEPVDIQTYENGDTVTVSDNSGKLVRTGFTFDGWNSKADGSGINYVLNNKFNYNKISLENNVLRKIYDTRLFLLRDRRVFT